MGPEPLLHRIRWANVARAASVVAALAFVVAWPHLAPQAPDPPPAAVLPAAGVAPSSVTGSVPPAVTDAAPVPPRRTLSPARLRAARGPGGAGSRPAANRQEPKAQPHARAAKRAVPTRRRIAARPVQRHRRPPTGGRGPAAPAPRQAAAAPARAGHPPRPGPASVPAASHPPPIARAAPAPAYAPRRQARQEFDQPATEFRR